MSGNQILKSPQKIFFFTISCFFKMPIWVRKFVVFIWRIINLKLNLKYRTIRFFFWSLITAKKKKKSVFVCRSGSSSVQRLLCKMNSGLFFLYFSLFFTEGKPSWKICRCKSLTITFRNRWIVRICLLYTFFFSVHFYPLKASLANSQAFQTFLSDGGFNF